MILQVNYLIWTVWNYADLLRAVHCVIASSGVVVHIHLESTAASAMSVRSIIQVSLVCAIVAFDISLFSRIPGLLNVVY